MKSIDTLVQDIEAVVQGKGGWDETVNSYFTELMSDTAKRRFGIKGEGHKPSLRMSNIGSPCTRKLWYHLNSEVTGEELQPHTLLKFAYGDLIEGLLLSLVKAAGHKVEGEQDEVVVEGIVGHRDCIIDGVTVDVKSASSQSFAKFKSNGLRADDPFGYIAQLTGYVYAGASDPRVRDKRGGAFLVLDKTNGHLCLDYYDLSDELAVFPSKLEKVRKAANAPVPPSRAYDPVPDGKSGNMKLDTACSYCDYKKACWPMVRTFLYSNGPKFLVDVKRTPDVPEVK